MDLMASAVNEQSDLQGKKLPFFSRFHCPGSSGVDLLAQVVPQGRHFCFPHPRMVKAAVHHVRRFRGWVCMPGEQGGSVKLTGGHVPHSSFIYLDRSILIL